MDGIPNIFQAIASTDGDTLDTYLEAINEHQSFRSEGSNSTYTVVQHITSVLSKPATRFEGLHLLNTYLEQCTAEILEQKGVLWMTLSLKSCNPKEAENVGNLVYVVLKKLVTRFVDLPDVSKTFVSNILSKIYDSLGTAIPNAYQAALQCVETCLRLYPGPSGPSRGSIEKFILRFTDVTDESLVLWGGKCYHLLQQVRGGGVQGISHKAAWQSYQIKLLGSLHSVLDLAFSNCTEVYDDPIEKEQLNIVPLQLNNEPVRRAMQIYTRFVNLVNHLVTALKEPFPVSKAISPKKILNLISRGLSVTCSMLEKNMIFDNLAIGVLLPKMHIKLFELLEATVMILRSHLAIYHKTILGFIFDTLKWTSSRKSTGQQKPYSMLRSAAYRTLTLWCNTMKHGSRCEIVAEGIIEEIMYDVTPFENEFTLKVLSGAKKHMSKKARRQLHKAQNEKSNLVQTHSNPCDSQAKKQILSDEGNQKLCIAALICMRTVLISAGCFIKPTVVKSLHLKIVNICLLLSDGTLKSDNLYSNYRCRLEVYGVLHSLILAPHHLCPPPTQMAIKLLQFAQLTDANVLVRDACSMLLNSLEKIIHPQKESLIFPPDIREIRNAFHKVGKERLLATQQGNEDDDETTDEDEEDKPPQLSFVEVAANGGNQIPISSEGLEMEASSIDLTLDDNRLRDPIHLDSSNDSVEFVLEEQSKPDQSPEKELMVEEMIDLPKSPELTLRVQEDEEDEVEESTMTIKRIFQNQDNNAMVINVDQEDGNGNGASPSSPKRPRLEETVTTAECVNSEMQAKTEEDLENNKNSHSFEEIAASFVDELN